MPKKAETPVADRTILVWGAGKHWTITVPGDAKTTFAPWSPPGTNARGYPTGNPTGTLRVYGRTKEHVLAVFSQVEGFRDLGLDYREVDPSILGVSTPKVENGTKKSRSGIVPYNAAPYIWTDDSNG